jgi:hypothetical protein
MSKAEALSLETRIVDQSPTRLSVSQSRRLAPWLRWGLCLTVGLGQAGCSSNRHKAEKIETEMENKAEISGDTKVGVKDGDLVVQRKVLLNEELRRLQNETYELEDRVYGSRKFGSLGLYGVLRECRAQLARREFGGSGKLTFQEPLERITDKEEELKIGLDEKKNLVAVSEEFLKDRIDRFRGYRTKLQGREDEFEEKVRICRNDLEDRKQQRAQQGSSGSGL